MSNRFVIFLFFLFGLAAINETPAQRQDRKEPDWMDKLFEKNVDFASFACREEDQTAVSDFFEKKPLNRILGICHNNCAIVASFSDRKFPVLSDKIKGKGFIAVHVLANESGRPIYARAVNGQPLMRRLAQQRVCDSKFEPHREKRQRVIHLCTPGDCLEPQPVRQ